MRSKGWLLLGMAACAGEGDTTSDSDPVAEPDFPSCAAQQVALRGTIGGASVDDVWQADGMGWAWINASTDEPGTFDVTAYGGTGMATVASFVFTETIAFGGDSPARGWVDLTSLDGPKLGNCPDSTDTPSTLYESDDGESKTFVLRDVREGELCGGEPTGEAVLGCVGPYE